MGIKHMITGVMRPAVKDPPTMMHPAVKDPPMMMRAQEVEVYREYNYEHLKNRPKINGHLLEGDLLLSELFSEGIILDGGGAADVGGDA